MTSAGMELSKLFLAAVISTCFRWKHSVCAGLWHDGKLTLFYHWQIAYAYENRVLFYDVYYAAGMYVSFLISFFTLLIHSGRTEFVSVTTGHHTRWFL
jgi:hypothetical protein